LKKYLPRYPDCFVCGNNNVIGLKRRFYVDMSPTGEVKRDEVMTDIIFTKEYIGFEGVVHGGVITALIDESMWWAATVKTKHMYVTADLNISFLRPVKVGEELTFKGRFVRSVKKLAICEGEAVNGSGEAFLKAKGRFFVMDDSLREKLIECLDFTEDTLNIFEE
jgi:uncharacterized protein (TIGR00369 family)